LGKGLVDPAGNRKEERQEGREGSHGTYTVKDSSEVIVC
jgi:hypothetical protein